MADLDRSQVIYLIAVNSGRGVMLRGVNLSQVDLRNLGLGTANLGLANLHAANQATPTLKADLHDTDLEYADRYALRGANLRNASYGRAPICEMPT
jgi:uncharacterized protein YjbI with pentapeptide repeats